MFRSKADEIFIENLEPRPGEPRHSDLWSQIYDYVARNYPDMPLGERGVYVSELLDYKEKPCQTKQRI